jgi:hypothetical protein
LVHQGQVLDYVGILVVDVIGPNGIEAAVQVELPFYKDRVGHDTINRRKGQGRYGERGVKVQYYVFGNSIENWSKTMSTTRDELESTVIARLSKTINILEGLQLT